MDSCFYVVNDTIQERHLNVGTREVWFNRAGHSGALTEAEYKRLLTIQGFKSADGPPHIEQTIHADSGTAPCPTCAGLGRVPAWQAMAAMTEMPVEPAFSGLAFPEPDVTADMGDAPTLDLDFEAPEDVLPEEELTPFPAPPAAPVPVTLAAEEIADWQGANVGRRIAWVEETNFDADQLLTLFNTEAAGKNSPRVLAAIDTRRNAILNQSIRGAVEVNAALIAANTPTRAEE